MLQRAYPRRLPGVRFDVPPPALDEALPRMDIAFFAGFTACGPMHLPVAVESLAEFEDVFGGPITLLYREDRTPVQGLLHGALRQFFSHGGRRAWVQRVAASHARSNWFPLQQMLLLRRASPTARWRAEPAWVLARSPGSWADALQVRSRCEGLPLSVQPLSSTFDGASLWLQALGPLAAQLGIGEVLKLPLADGEWLLGRVAAVAAADDPNAPGEGEHRLRLDRLASLRLDTRGVEPVRLGWTAPATRGDGTVEQGVPASGQWVPDAQAGQPRLRLQCRLPARAQLGLGEVLRVSFADGRSPAWMAVDELQTTALGEGDGLLEARLSGLPLVLPVRVRAAAVAAWLARTGRSTAQWLRAAVGVTGGPGSAAGAPAPAPSAAPSTATLFAASPAPPPAPVPPGPGAAPSNAARGGSVSGAVERAGPESWRENLALVLREDGAPSLLSLPDDEAHYASLQRGPARRGGQAEQAFELRPPDAPARAGPRFALASPSLALPPEGEALLLPLAIGPGLTTGLGARFLPLLPLRRDGLDVFNWRLFAEESLAGFHADALAAQAEALRMLGRVPRPLRGLHAVFGTAVEGPVEEPTLLAVPDAVQPGWKRRRAPKQPRLVLDELPGTPPPPSTAAAGFADCSLTPLPAPQFLEDAPPDATGRFTLRWTQPEPRARFELQEAADRALSVATLAYSGTGTRLVVVGKSAGTLHYRVRALQGPRTSPWSRVLRVQVGVSSYELRPWHDADLLALHRLLLRAAAGRGDLLALLGLPEHYRWPEAQAHARKLRSAVPVLDASAPPALGSDEGRALSHGMLAHPWVLTRRLDEVIASPPDGALAGQLAASALDRGAWFAVAHQPLKDVVALSLPTSPAEQQALLEAQVNPLIASPRGFIAGTSETLCLEADWRAVNVRRLMCLLRRAALRRGATYVFEPHGAPLRRTVERAFETLLDELLRRGALAGGSAAEAYRVDVSEALNTPARLEAGQLRIDLKVAPALPLSFLTVRLARSGERLSALELR